MRTRTAPMAMPMPLADNPVIKAIDMPINVFVL
jgi:hypothetical protein